MKRFLLFLCFVFSLSCNTNEKSKESKTENSFFSEKDNHNHEKLSDSSISILQNESESNESKVLNSKFDVNLLFGIWTIDPDGPHADFHLSKKSFYVVDYDGNGEMPYHIHKDTLKVFFKDYTSIGIIKRVSLDSLIIDWDHNGNTNYTKWKE